MDITQEYRKLAMTLGDIMYKLALLENAKAETLEKIKKLDQLAAMTKGTQSNEATNTATESNSAGSNSPV